MSIVRVTEQMCQTQQRLQVVYGSQRFVATRPATEPVPPEARGALHNAKALNDVAMAMARAYLVANSVPANEVEAPEAA